jgi:hypothetical protein
MAKVREVIDSGLPKELQTETANVPQEARA